jgi:hypothetical protein
VKLLTTRELVLGAKAKTASLVPAMAHQSYPIPLRGGGTLDVLFLYCVARPVFREGLSMLAPSHRGALSAVDGGLKEVRAVESQDLGVSDPPQKILGFWKMPADVTTEEFCARQERLYGLLDHLMPIFAELREAPLREAASFDELFRQVSEGPLLPYYAAVGIDFFGWLAAARP